MKYNSKQETGGYGGCLVIIIAVVMFLAMVFASCSTTNGCGNPVKWEQKNKFNK